MRRSDEQTLAVIVHTISTIKKIAKDDQSSALMSFEVKEQKSTLAAYDIANIFPNKKDNV